VPGLYRLIFLVGDASQCQARAVLDKVDDEAGERTVVFCGHSLGGAVALLLGLACALRRRQSGSNETIATVMTFGCPRIGDEDLRRHLKEFIDHRRLFVDEDSIAGMPSSTIKELCVWSQRDEYASHVAKEHWLLPVTGCANTSGSTLPSVTSALRHMHYLDRHALATYATKLVEHRESCETEVNASARRERAARAPAPPAPTAAAGSSGIGH